MKEIRKGIYRHYKNKKEYRVWGIARHTETDEDVVLYEPLYEGSPAEYWIRPYDMFMEKITDPETGEDVDRFQFVREE